MIGIMENKIKCKVSDCGMFAQAVNPYLKISNVGYDGKTWISGVCKDFDTANPPRPLTTYQTPLSEVECREVWQYQHRGSTEWNKPIGLSERTFEKWSETMYNLHDAATRLAFEPITAPVDGFFDENGDLDMGKAGAIIDSHIKAITGNKFSFFSPDTWNSALDEAIKVFRPGMFITIHAYDCAMESLNQLRK